MLWGIALAGEDQPDDGSWYPRTTTGERGTVVIYAPQIDGWTDFETLTAWLAFSATRTGEEETHYGSLRFSASTDTDLANREVLLHDIEVNELTIEGIEADAPELELAKAALTSRSRRIPLDLVLEYLPQEIPLAANEGLNDEPPVIFVSTEPAILLSIDSSPVFLPVDGTGLTFVLNANWDVLREGEEGPLYLCYQNDWIKAERLEGPWGWAEALPSAFAGVPHAANWTNVRACLPEQLHGLARDGEPPLVYYTTEPAELVQLRGDPQWTSIGDGLDYAANTAQEVFRIGGRVYLLLSGRWFVANDLNGPWSHAARLPDAFQSIPPGDAHPKSHVRKSVPGTQEAWEAALVASIPRKAEIARGTEADLHIDVDYGGRPVFQPIEGTEIRMAMNTSYQVFEYADAYFVCHNATWLSGPSPEGPWTFADTVPDEFAKIPPSSPAYNTTFVTAEASDDETIEYSYTSGYENAYVSNGTVVNGTGFAVTAASVWVLYEAFDDDYWYGYPGYPYYPWPPTYGYGSWYDPDTGRYGETIVGYGPYGAARGTAVFNPETGVYARGQAVWDSDEFAGRSYGYNPNTDTSIARNRYVDFEDEEGWSNRVARRGDEWRYAESEWEDGEMRTEFESSRGSQGEVTRERNGDTLESSGEIRYGDREATFESERELDGDRIVGEGTISGEERAVSFESEREDGRADISLSGSEGGTGEIVRQIEDGEISGSGAFTRDGRTIETDTTRTAEGTKRDFETSEGGRGTALRSGDERAFAFESGSGDIYAGRDGDVYQKTDSGWSKVENPRSGAASATTADRSAARDAYDRSARSASRDFNQLERDRQSRQRGYERYSRFEPAGRSGGMRRGRRF